jgi:excisionase family DNA binding protein
MANLMTPKELSEYLQVADETLQYWRRNGTGPAFVRVATLIRYKREDVEKWLEERRVDK